MKKLGRILTWVENVLAAGTLGLAALISMINIISRQVGVSWFWTEEAVIYLIIFSTFFGAIITLRHDEHVSVDILGTFFKDRGRKWLALLGGVITLSYLGIMSVLGWMLLAEPFSRTTVTPVLKLPLWVVESAVPIGMTLMFLRALEMLWRTWKHGSPVAEGDDMLVAEAEATGLTLEQVKASYATIADDEDESSQDDDSHGRSADEPEEGAR